MPLAINRKEVLTPATTQLNLANMRPGTTGHVLYDSTYRRCPEQADPELESTLIMAARAWRRGEE